MVTELGQVTIRDVAGASGVSVPTVSRILNGIASDIVSEKTRKRVTRLAAEMHYAPNAAARQLRTRRSMALGLLMPAIVGDAAETYAFSQQLAGVVEEVAAAGYGLVVAAATRERQPPDIILTRKVDGVLLMHPLQDDPCLEAVLRVGVPIVVMNEILSGPAVSWVDIDNVGGSRDAVRHLAALGHKNIGFISHRPGYAVSALRLRGYKEALESCELEHSDDSVAEVPELGSMPATIAATERLLSMKHPPTAILCLSDAVAYGALRAADRKGLSVPTDLALVGFDDEPLSAYQRPPLTSVRAPFLEKGRASARLLIDLIEGRASAPVSRSLPTRLVVRESSRGAFESVREG
jgi:DNA-binding LacI/PurR family transcriptional regulator